MDDYSGVTKPDNHHSYHVTHLLLCAFLSEIVDTLNTCIAVSLKLNKCLQINKCTLVWNILDVTVIAVKKYGRNAQQYYVTVHSTIFAVNSHVYTATNREGSTRVEHGLAKKLAV